ncbi:uncharacterized protein LOC126381111 [Pectinophora gossypiella]|uniref:uncharacterized protein LOC126381111 n=1 Tax=Pectinophora gossypiella TaxID=13191 RepID=UPI00214E25D7|nr:uncharacterized protein LOC126381111 [Pectinophora gossypiella]
MSSSLTLEKFDCEGDPTSVGARWERWKRALDIYLHASSIEQGEKKRSSLLHFGGFELQEIFYNIPGANVEAAEGVDVYSVAIAKLDAYFAPKQSKVYERHLFRLIKQEPDEKFEKFILRLRQQADKCQFQDKNDNIIDQITEKCAQTELRKKILQIGDEITLDKIISEANTLEAVNKQMEGFNNKNNTEQGINKIDSRSKRTFNNNKIHRTGCGRCGNPKHLSHDARCPAKEKDCLKCGLKGHFRQFCRTKQTFKRKIEQTKKEDYDSKKNKQNCSIILMYEGDLKIINSVQPTFVCFTTW